MFIDTVATVVLATSMRIVRYLLRLDHRMTCGMPIGSLLIHILSIERRRESS